MGKMRASPQPDPIREVTRPTSPERIGGPVGPEHQE